MNLFKFFASPQLRDLTDEVNAWIEANGVDINTWDFSRPQSPEGDFILVVYYSEANPGNQIGFKNHTHEETNLFDGRDVDTLI